jgi:hypothetical protein
VLPTQERSIAQGGPLCLLREALSSWTITNTMKLLNVIKASIAT